VREKPHNSAELVPAPAANGNEPTPTLARKLGFFDITMLVMGSVIGVGIFVVPHDVAALVPQPSLVLAAWVLGGLSTLAGSLVYAELARRRPHAGGQYAYLREAYRPAVAFVYGWSLLWIIQSGGLASVAVIFARYFLELLHTFGGWLGVDEGSLSTVAESRLAAALVASAAIATLTAVNCAGVRTGSTAQNIFMMLKILAIALLVVCGLAFADGQWSVIRGVQPNDRPEVTAGGLANSVHWPGMTAFAAAMVPVLFAYGGSHTTTFVAGEVHEPRRNLARGLVLGVSGVIVLYLAVNYVCLKVLGVDELALTKSPAAEVMARALGAPGAALISAGIAVSALGFLSQGTLTSPRVYYAMAKDGLFFPSVAWIHPRTRVPVVAILLQGAFAMVIAVSGTFEQILNYVMSVEMVFLSLTALGLFVIRRRDAGETGSAALSMPGHPVTTLVFASVNIALVLNLFLNFPKNSAIGIGVALAGIPVYFLWSSVNRARPTSQRSTPAS
jgi:APA family basic amino acid/polyamine antiporter